MQPLVLVLTVTMDIGLIHQMILFRNEKRFLLSLKPCRHQFHRSFPDISFIAGHIIWAVTKT